MSKDKKNKHTLADKYIAEENQLPAVEPDKGLEYNFQTLNDTLKQGAETEKKLREIVERERAARELAKKQAEERERIYSSIPVSYLYPPEKNDPPANPGVVSYNKLVRDKIPLNIMSEGHTCRVRKLSEAELEKALRKKLTEEVQEYFDSDDPHELVDILEVLKSIAARTHNNFDLEAESYKKEKDNGTFQEGYFLIDVEEKKEDDGIFRKD